MGRVSIFAGPPFAGKSREIARELAHSKRRGETALAVDFSELFAALAGQRRGPQGLPVREAGDPRLEPVARVFYSTLVQLAERERLRVLVSTSSRSKADEIRELVGGADVQIVDPGREVVLERIRERYGGVIPPECEKAIERWYGDT